MSKDAPPLEAAEPPAPATPPADSDFGLLPKAKGSPAIELIARTWTMVVSLFPRFFGVAAPIWAVFLGLELAIGALVGRPNPDSPVGYAAALAIIALLHGIAAAVVMGGVAILTEAAIFDQPVAPLDVLALLRIRLGALIGYGCIIGFMSGVLELPKFLRWIGTTSSAAVAPGNAEIFAWLMLNLIAWPIVMLTISIAPAASTIEGGPLGYGCARSQGLLSGRRLKLIAGWLCTDGLMWVLWVTIIQLLGNPTLETIQRLLLVGLDVLGSIPLAVFLAVLYQDSDAAERGMLRPEWLPDVATVPVEEPVVEAVAEPVAPAKPVKAAKAVAEPVAPVNAAKAAAAVEEPKAAEPVETPKAPEPEPEPVKTEAPPRAAKADPKRPKVWDLSLDTEEKPAPRTETPAPAAKVVESPVSVEPAAEPPAKVEEPAKAEPIKVEEPTKAKPAKVEEPAKAEPVKVEEPAKAEPVKVEEPAKAEPVKVEEPAKAEPVKVEEPAKAEPVKVEEPKKAEPVKTPAVKPKAESKETPKISASAATINLSLQQRLYARAASRRQAYQDPPTQKLSAEQAERTRAFSRKETPHRRSSDSSDADVVPGSVPAPTPAAWERTLEAPPTPPEPRG